MVGNSFSRPGSGCGNSGVDQTFGLLSRIGLRVIDRNTKVAAHWQGYSQPLLGCVPRQQCAGVSSRSPNPKPGPGDVAQYVVNDVRTC